MLTENRVYVHTMPLMGISLEMVYQSSDSKISCMQELRGIIEVNPVDLDCQFKTWEAKNQAILATQRITFFNKPLNKNQEAVEQIKRVLGVGQLKEVDGFVVLNNENERYPVLIDLAYSR